MGLIFILTGPSGVGKTTIAKHLEQEYQFKRPVTATTRAKRSEELGHEYNFVSKEQFIEMINQGEIIEHVEYNRNLYGSPMSAFNVNHHLVVVLEHRGAARLKELFGERCIVILLNADKNDLEDRIKARSVLDESEFIYRMQEAEYYNNLAADHVIHTSKTIDQVVLELKQTINKYVNIINHG